MILLHPPIQSSHFKPTLIRNLRIEHCVLNTCAARDGIEDLQP